MAILKRGSSLRISASTGPQYGCLVTCTGVPVFSTSITAVIKTQLLMVKRRRKRVAIINEVTSKSSVNAATD